MIVYQVGAIVGMARYVGHKVAHVKPHGTLGNAAVNLSVQNEWVKYNDVGHSHECDDAAAYFSP